MTACRHCGLPIEWVADPNALLGGDWQHVDPFDSRYRRQQCEDSLEHAAPVAEGEGQ